MRNNILRRDLDALIAHLQQDDPILTNGANVRAFGIAERFYAGLRGH
jgi:CDP-6-deoxy-D-xylo-4-hexulose-3-dehydrase